MRMARNVSIQRPRMVQTAKRMCTDARFVVENILQIESMHVDALGD